MTAPEFANPPRGLRRYWRENDAGDEPPEDEHLAAWFDEEGTD
jgi:hypothetical protein